MTRRFAGTFAAALSSLGIFAGTAGAISSSGFYNSSNSTNSFQSPPQGTCYAANSTAAGNNARSVPIQFWAAYFCGQG